MATPIRLRLRTLVCLVRRSVPGKYEQKTCFAPSRFAPALASPPEIEISSGLDYRVALSLSPGHKLAHYEILEPIGKGGVGEVYRAKDTKLGRDVAIKVLPEEFSRNKERSERFEREARLLAQLNHSNIATRHGFEESDGRQFLVMELSSSLEQSSDLERGRHRARVVARWQ